MDHRVFAKLSRFPAAKSSRGSSQFKLHQSKGIAPEDPTHYYLCLEDGKRQFDWLCSEYHVMWQRGEWWGFLQCWKDWKGSRWILPHLCRWFSRETGRDLPEWLSMEVPESEIHDILDKENEFIPPVSTATN